MLNHLIVLRLLMIYAHAKNVRRNPVSGQIGADGNILISDGVSDATEAFSNNLMRKTIVGQAASSIEHNGDLKVETIVHNQSVDLTGTVKVGHSEARDYQHPPWLSGCKRIYLDVGSNIGVQVRKLYEAAKYPNSSILPFFTKHFGPPATRRLPGNESGLCALGLEPNPGHALRLQRIQEAYTAKNWHVHFYHFAAWKAEGTMDFWVDPNYEEGGTELAWNAQLAKDQDDAGGKLVNTRVRTVDLSDFVVSLPSGAVKFMKMDIEGAEYEVLTHMIEKWTLCSEIILEGSVEAHPWGKAESWKGNKSYSGIKEAVAQTNCLPNDSVTSILELDDESYANDVDDHFGELALSTATVEATCKILGLITVIGLIFKMKTAREDSCK